MKTFILKSLVPFMTFALIMSACQKSPLEPENLMVSGKKSVIVNGDGSTSCAPDTTTLWAGQHNDWGKLIVWNDGISLFVKYVNTSSVSFGTLHLWAGSDLLNLPVNNQGIPNPGHFPYHFDATGLSEYTFQIPLSSLFSTAVTDYCNKQVYVFAHAEMGTETAWGGNIAGTSTRWYFYSIYTICCATVTPPPVEYVNETAFAKFSKSDGGYVFTTNRKSNPESYPTLALTQNRWGWAGNLKLGVSYTAPIYAGAGLNYISNGKLVGTLTVTPNGSGQVVVTYSLNTNVTMGEVHIYLADATPLTLAPGQYGHIAYFDPKVNTYSYTFDVNDLNGDGKYWVIAHAVVTYPAPVI